MNEWDKKDTIIVRFFEGSGVPSTAQIKFNELLSKKISTIKVVDLLEREIKYKYDWNKKSGILTFNIDKFEICTFELFF